MLAGGPTLAKRQAHRADAAEWMQRPRGGGPGGQRRSDPGDLGGVSSWDPRPHAALEEPQTRRGSPEGIAAKKKQRTAPQQAVHCPERSLRGFGVGCSPGRRLNGAEKDEEQMEVSSREGLGRKGGW
ncbi:hypothetical protein NDU88_004838 [Pleurodeles waltl]|uniref:Uncharacterized protein n=1 Tax=Pleurodeles waltl TaxID=8319 RepID=A0AAV7SJY7_PLEWA|nr:hypothetical protein NDU88_004838 [Pleurodeles waltl]